MLPQIEIMAARVPGGRVALESVDLSDQVASNYGLADLPPCGGEDCETAAEGYDEPTD